MPVNKVQAGAIQSALKRKGLTQEEFAAQLGISPVHFRTLANGERTPGDALAKSLSESLEIDPDVFNPKMGDNIQ